MKINKYFYVLTFVFYSFCAFADTISIYADKKTLSENDTLYLTVEYTGNSNSTPDFTSLTNDFSIVSKSTSNQYSFINGQSKQSKKWTLGLSPKNTGKVIIRPIKFENLISNSLTVNIKELTDVAYIPDSENNYNSPFFKIEQNIDTPAPFVQQQTILSVTIYDSVGLKDSTISVDDETKNNWKIVPILKEPIVTQSVENNRRVSLITYKFAAFPQKSGKLKLPQFQFDGYYFKDLDVGFPSFGNSFKLFDMDFSGFLGQKIPVSMKTKQATIDVKSIPQYFSGDIWLPVKNLEITTNWSIKNGFKVGEAVTRSLNIEITGSTQSVLPKFKLPDIQNLKQYPEKEDVLEVIAGGNIVTQAKYNIVFIPTKAGNFTIPELSVYWYNTETNQIEETIVPAEDITVLPNGNLTSNNNDNNSVQIEESNKTNTVKENEPQKENIEKTLLSKLEKLPKQLILYSALFFIFIMSIIFWYIKRRKRNFSRNLVIKYLRMHDYKSAKDSLLKWAEKKYTSTNIKNFNDLSVLVQNNEFSEQLSLLNKMIYSENNIFFDVAKFIETFKKIDSIKIEGIKKNDKLPNLYD